MRSKESWHARSLILAFPLLAFGAGIGFCLDGECDALKSASSVQMNSAFGGVCFGCLTQFYCWNNTPCHEEAENIYSKKSGTGINQKFCYDTESGGYSVCRTLNPQDCMQIFTCTDEECTNCGPPGTERKDTECSFIPGIPCG